MATISKQLKKAVMDVIMDGIKRTNYFNDTFGGRLNDWGSVVAQRMLHENGIRVHDNAVEQNGTPIAKIHRRYSQRRVHLCYRELKPTIEWLVEAA